MYRNWQRTESQHMLYLILLHTLTHTQHTHMLAGHYSPIDYSWCSSGTGRNYAGNIHRTRSGLDCQSWASQSPHKHPFWPSKYSSELITNTFACRNPGGVGDGPWCYTSDRNVRWEYCDVPQCGKSINIVASIILSMICCVMIVIFLRLSLSLSLSLSSPLSLTHTRTHMHLYSTEVCQQYYRGYGFCDSIEGYSDGNRTVYVDRSTSKWGLLGFKSVDQYLENLLPELIGNDTWTPGCEHSIRQLLCHITLPFCKDQGERERGERER